MSEVARLRRELREAERQERESTCRSCRGAGWFLDTTYNRSGEMVRCGKCYGSGLGARTVAQIIEGAFSPICKPKPESSEAAQDRWRKFILSVIEE